MGAVFSLILLAWTAAAWFSGPYGRPFLGCPLFGVPPLIPFAAFLPWSLAVFYLWLRRHGKTAWEKMSQYLQRDRKTVVILGGILVFHLVVISGPAILNYWGENDADSGLHGVAGYHIAAGTERPMYVYGFHHVGTLKAHIAALFNRFLGRSPMYQRAIGAILYLGFLVGLFIFVRRLFNEKTALLAAALAAVPPFAAAAQLRYDEFIELPFWGIIGFNLLLSLCCFEHSHQDTKTRRKKVKAEAEEVVPSGQFVNACGEAPAPMHSCIHASILVPSCLGGNTNWKYYFWYGVVLGLQFFAHPQAIFFIVTGLIVIFAVDKLFFLRWRNWLIPLGFIIGTIPTWIDSYFHNWIIFRTFFGEEIQYAGRLWGRLDAVMKNFYRNFTEFWGLGPIYPLPFTVPQILIAVVMIAALAGLIYYVYITRVEISNVFGVVGRGWQPHPFRTKDHPLTRITNTNTKKDSNPPEAEVMWNPGRLIPLIMAAAAAGIFCLSLQTVNFGPFRYMYVLWIVIPIFIAVSATHPKSKWGKGLGMGFLVISLVLFSISQFHYITATHKAGERWQNWVNFCLQKKITHFYGDFWLVYHTNFISKEEIIGSVFFRTNNDPYMKYREMVDYASKPPAYVFSLAMSYGANRQAEWLTSHLHRLHIRFTRGKINRHIVFYNLSEHITPAQLFSLPLQ